MDSEEIKYFYREYQREELREWFFSLIKEYKKWADFRVEHKEARQASIKELAFPYPYREGQKELAEGVYRTIYHKRRLFLEAPTGVGKTLSTVFPSIKALGEELGERIFYFTAKTITRTVAEEAFSLLRKKGLEFKTVILTAKDKICFQDEVNCNPEACPYAKGHFDRINEVLYEMITRKKTFSRKTIEEYALKYRVCPFELALDSSLFADGIIGDYNYLFDPHVSLKRFFAEGAECEGIFLIDEAHNLVERGREMYSASLIKEDFLALKKQMQGHSVKIGKQLEKCNRELLALKKESDGVKKWESIENFIVTLERLSVTMSEYLENHNDNPVREKILEFYFTISHFLLIYDNLGDDYVIYSQMDDKGEFILKLFCVNPARMLKSCMDKGISSILFSATLLPIQYYKALLGGRKEDYEIYAKSPFDESKRALLIANDVTTRYTRRTDNEFYSIASYINSIVKQRPGNYMIFFPSYTVMEKIHKIYQDNFNKEQAETCILQKESMTEEERENFLKHFTGNLHLKIEDQVSMEIEVEESSLLGFCVVGGIFSEGIDLKSDSLIGTIIVGTGLPAISTEREILREYYENLSGGGFDFAYRYPGMNKVLQAAGRVIRTSEDVGVIALLDERFLEGSYRGLFPREWSNFQVVNHGNVAKKLQDFWKICL